MRAFLPKRSFLLVLLLALLLPAATPFATNAQTVAAAPEFSVQRGFYDAAFSLTLTVPSGLTVRYTLDGSTPSPSAGTIYTGPIAISGSAVVRAVAYSQTQTASPVATHSYIFPSSVRSQSATPLPGWPSQFATADLNGSYPADYEMDPEVVNHPNNVNKFDTVLKSLPSISLVTDLPNLWHPTAGIYANPNARGNSPLDPFSSSWERAVSLEWINPDGTSGFSQIAGASIDGDTSRRPHRQVKKDFRLNFDSKYGTAGLSFDLFDASLPTATFDQLLLRNGGKRTWTYFDRDQRREADYINDEFARRAWLDMGNVGPHGTYAHLYINGLYWGLYNVTEHVNPEFLVSYVGTTPENFDIVQAGDDINNSPLATSGTADAWNQVIAKLTGNLPVDDTLYMDIADEVDVVSLADYLIHAHYIGKTDWPDEYWNAYRAKTGLDQRFKFVPLDNDSGLNKVTENTTPVTDSVGLQDSPDSVFRRLMTNNQFKQVVADRFFKHVVSSTGALSAASCTARYTQLAGIVDQAVIAESARWGDYIRDVYPQANVAPKAFPAYLHSRDLPLEFADPANLVVDADQKTWLQVRDDKLNNYCPARSTNLRNYYQAQGWYNPGVLPPTANPASGMVASGTTVNLGNPSGAGSIYATTDGSDPRPANGGAPSILPTTSVQISTNATLKARVFDGANWSPLLEQAYFINQSFGNLVINEVHYGPIAPLAPAGENPNDYEFIELHNRGGSPISLQGVTFSSGVYYAFSSSPNTTTIPAGGYLVLASNAAKFQARYGFAPDGVFTGSLLNGGEKLTLSNPVGGEIDTVSYQGLAPWPTGANAGGGSLSLIEPTLNNSLPTSWEASHINGGTPKADNDDVPDGKAVPTLSVNAPATIVYGTLLQINTTAQVSGSDVAGTVTYNPPLSKVLNAGLDQPVQVIFEPNNTNAYVGVNQTILVDVTPAPLTITALNKIKQINTPNPVLEAGYTGFVNGDTAASLDVLPTLSTTAVLNSPLGDYPITASGAFDPNYTITYVGGILTVTNKAVPLITWATPAPIVYGTPLGPDQLNATATVGGQPVAGTFTYTPAAGTVLNAGNQTLSVRFTPTNLDSYVEVNSSVTIDVARAPLTVRADNKRKLVGTENPPLTASYVGLVNGDTAASLDAQPVLSTTAVTASPVGIYPITVSGAADANYVITFVDGTLTVATTLEQEKSYKVSLPLVKR